jgi:predicted amidohydrolase YtcJ
MTPMICVLGALVMPAADPDLVLVNGKVWTGNAAQPEAEAVVIRGGKIDFVGPTADAKRKAKEGDKVIDLKGQRVVPGFHDSHAHFLGGGESLARVDLKDAKDEAEFGKRLAAFDAKLPKGRWITGGLWDHDRAFKGVAPTAAIVDKYVKDRPVFVNRYDGHMALANSAALKIAGITKETKDPSGGVVDRDADGNPTGLLRDNAMNLVGRLVPAPDDQEIAEAVAATLKYAAEIGVTSINDMEGNGAAVRKKYYAILQKLAAEGKLTCRVDVRNPIGLLDEAVGRAGDANPSADWVRGGGVKGFMDGSLGSSTAKMFDPYEGKPGNVGVYVTQPEAMKNMVRAADAKGLSVAVHAIGDQANAVLLDIYEAVAKENGPKDRRFRVEHVQHLRPQDYTRFKALGVVASMQPYHMADDARWAEGRIGAKRCASSYAFKSLLDAGAILAFGSDWPVAPLDPIPGIDAAVNRRPLDAKVKWFPEQGITVAETVAAYTAGSAYAEHRENQKGKIAPGMFGDMVVLDRDIFDAKEVENIGKTKVAMTVCGGKVVFERK